MIGAVDIGGSKLAVGIVNENGALLSKMDMPKWPDRYYTKV